MNAKRIWATTDTGWKWHAFEDKSARCRKNIRPRMYAITHDDFRPLDQVQERFTDTDICPKCLAAVRMEEQARQSLLNQAHAEALEMNAKATEKEVVICARQVRDPRTGRVAYCIKPQGHGSVLYSEQVEARGHLIHPTHDRAREMAEALEMNAGFDYALRCAEERARVTLTDSTTEQKETTPMGAKDGPLTERQTRIIELASSGRRQNEIAKELDVSYPVVRMEVNAVIHKFGADSSGQVYALYATARAYQEAADLLDKASREHPEQDGVAEDHANHVLMGLANILRERAERLLPK